MHIEIQNCFSFWGTSSPDPLPGFAPGPHWGTSVPQAPCTGRPPHILYQVYASEQRRRRSVCGVD